MASSEWRRCGFKSTSLREARLIHSTNIYVPSFYLNPLASGRLDCKSKVHLLIVTDLNPLASGRLDSENYCILRRL